LESAVEHGEQNSHLTLNPTALLDMLRRIQAKVGNPENAGSGRGEFSVTLFLPSDCGVDYAPRILFVAPRDSVRNQNRIARSNSITWLPRKTVLACL